VTTQTFSYLYDLSGIQFDDNTTSSWIQAFPVGKYQHPTYGEINVTPERVKAFAASVNNKVRGTDLDIDYDHKAQTQIAAGWVKQAEARPDGLYLHVDWTPAAAKKIMDKEYRYFSPEYTDSWTDNQGVTHTDVLFGGALTNRPFLKNIQPVNLSEAMTKLLATSAPPTSPNDGTGTRTDPQSSSVAPLSVDDALGRMADLLGLDHNADHNQILGAVSMLTKDEASEGDDETKEPGQGNDKETQMSDKDKGGGAPAVTLSDQQLMEHPVFKQMSEKLAVLEAANRLAEVQRQLTELSEGNYVLTPAVRELAEPFMLTLPAEACLKFSEILRLFVERKGIVELGERGIARQHISAEEQLTGVKAFSDAVARVRAEDKTLSYTDAVRTVAANDPQLYENYRLSTLAGE